MLLPAVASSSSHLRRRRIGGRPLGHVCDPRTGLPIPDEGGTTVLSESAAWADACSTALLVAGEEFLEQLDDARTVGLVIRGDRFAATGKLRPLVTQWEPEKEASAWI